jgi:hypothetical protein
MRISNGEFLRRVEAVCCRLWGVAPWEFRRAMAAEEIDLGSVVEALVLGSADRMTVAPLAYIFREAEQAKRERVERIREASAQLERAQSEDERERLAELIRELNQWQGSP